MRQLWSRTVILLVISFSLPILLIAADPAAPAAAKSAPAGEWSEVATPAKTDPAADKFWQAVKLLNSTKPVDLAAGRVALQSSVDLGFTHAQVLLANCLIAGSNGMTKNARKGANLFRLAAERGNAFAKVSLGQCYGTGTGLSKNFTKATDSFKAALAPEADFSRPVPPADFFRDTPDTVSGELAGDPVAEAQATAHCFLGLICDERKQLPEAHVHFVAAAQAGRGGRDGMASAANRAALNCAFGRGTPRNLTQASALLDQSRKLKERMQIREIHHYTTMKIVDEFATADMEEATSKEGEVEETILQLQIAALFANKQAKEYNPAEAVKWYELVAESGNEWAMLSLGLLYAEGASGQPDFNRAFAWLKKAGEREKPQYYRAVANLGICLQNGLGTEKNTTKAAELFKKYRDADIVCYLGTIGQCPDHIVTLGQEVALNEKWAGEKNDTQAQYLLALRYLNDGRAKSKVANLLKKAADSGHAAALCELGFLYERQGARELGMKNGQERIAAADCYRRSAELGNVDAMANLAGFLYLGWGTNQDQAGAEAMYQHALRIDPLHGRTHFNLAGIYGDRLSESLLKKDSVDADKWRALMVQHYEKALELEYQLAAEVLGKLFYDGVRVEQDYRRAYGYYQKATEWGANLLHYPLGRMHELGLGVPVTYAEAAYHYRLAALNGNMAARQRLYRLYATGKGVPRDLERAIYWASTATWNTDPLWVSDLADLYIQNKNYDLAFRIFSDFSTARSPVLRGIANHRLYVLYSYGWGVTKDVKKARRFLEKSLKDGNLTARHDNAMALIAEGQKSKGISLLETLITEGQPNSKYELGRMFLKGEDMPKNVTRGITLIKEAADVGIEEAEVALATLTLEDSPGAPDLESAIRLATAAAARGSSNGVELLEKLEKRREKKQTDPEDIAKARSS